MGDGMKSVCMFDYHGDSYLYIDNGTQLLCIYSYICEDAPQFLLYEYMKRFVEQIRMAGVLH